MPSSTTRAVWMAVPAEVSLFLWPTRLFLLMKNPHVGVWLLKVVTPVFRSCPNPARIT